MLENNLETLYIFLINYETMFVSFFFTTVLYLLTPKAIPGFLKLSLISFYTIAIYLFLNPHILHFNNNNEDIIVLEDIIVNPEDLKS